MINAGMVSNETLNESSSLKKGDSANLALSASKEDFVQSKLRLQKQKAQSRRSFRMKKSQKSTEKEIIKLDSVDIEDKAQLNSLIKKDSLDSSLSSPGYASTVQSLLPSPQGRDTENDSNGNINSNVNCDIPVLDKSTMIKTMETQLNNNNNNNNGNATATITNNNNNTEYPMRVIADLGLSLTRRTGPDNPNTLSPFETTLSTLPFADEEV